MRTAFWIGVTDMAARNRFGGYIWSGERLILGLGCDKTLCDYIDDDPSSGQIVSSFVLSSEQQGRW